MNNSLHIEKWEFHPPGNLRYEADVWRSGLLHLIFCPFTLWLQLRMFGSDLPTSWKCTELRIQISQGESYCVDLQLVSCWTVTTCPAGPGTPALEFGPLRRCRWYQGQFCLVSCWGSLGRPHCSAPDGRRVAGGDCPGEVCLGLPGGAACQV